MTVTVASGVMETVFTIRVYVHGLKVGSGLNARIANSTEILVRKTRIITGEAL